MMFQKKKQEENIVQDDVLDNDIPLDSDEGDMLLDEEPPKKKKKLPAWVIIPIIALIGGGAFAADRVFGDSAAQTANVSANVIEATKGSVSQTYNASGTIISGQVKTYYSPVTAPIATFNAIVGNTVKSGDTLVTFDTTQLERDNQQSQLTLAQGRNSSAQSRENAARTVAEADRANAQLADQANNLANRVNAAAAEADLRAAESDAAWANLQNRIQTLQDEAMITNQRNQANIQRYTAIITEAEQTMAANQLILDDYNENFAYHGNLPEIAASGGDIGQTDDVTKAWADAYNRMSKAKEDFEKAQKEKEDAESKLPAIMEVDPSLYANEQETYDTAQAAYQAAAAEYDSLYAQWESAYEAATNDATTADGLTATTDEGLNISDNLAELAALTPAELVVKGREGVKADIDGVISEVSVSSSSSLAGAAGATASAAAATSSQSVSPGTTVSQGGALFTISSNTNVKVSIELSPDDYNKLKTGTKATITVGDSQYNGTLTKINKIATTNSKGNSVIGAEVRIDNPDDQICIGSTAKVHMIISESDDVITIPLQAVNTSSSGEFVYLVDDNNVIQKQPITLGTSSETMVAVTEGLSEGDVIVNDMNTGISEGVTITPITSDDAQSNSSSSAE